MTEQNWIPVSQSLPPPRMEGLLWSDPVLVHLENGIITTDSYRHSSLGMEGFWLKRFAYDCHVPVVTHWMPLPPPPKE